MFLACLSLMPLSGLIFPEIALGATEAPKAMYVKLKESKVRAEPSHLSSVVSTVRYGEAVQPLDAEPSKGWFKVKALKGSGYLHLSAVTPKKVVISGAKVNQNADRADLVMAGKGFSLKVEKKYAAQNSTLNFSAVNQMEKLIIADKDLKSFAKEGQLSLSGGN